MKPKRIILLRHGMTGYLARLKPHLQNLHFREQVIHDR